MNNRGFTLTEILVAVIILGILSSMALVNYSKSVDVSRKQAATNILQSMYGGEKVFFSMNNAFRCGLDSTSTAADWDDVFMEVPAKATEPVQYAVADNGSGAACTDFIATATATLGGSTTATATIDNNRNVIYTGTWNTP